MPRLPLHEVHALVERVSTSSSSSNRTLSLSLPASSTRLPAIPAAAAILVARARLVHVPSAKLSLALRAVTDPAAVLPEVACGLLVAVGGGRVVVGVATADAGGGVEPHHVGAVVVARRAVEVVGVATVRAVEVVDVVVVEGHCDESVGGLRFRMGVISNGCRREGETNFWSYICAIFC